MMEQLFSPKNSFTRPPLLLNFPLAGQTHPQSLSSTCALSTYRQLKGGQIQMETREWRVRRLRDRFQLCTSDRFSHGRFCTQQSQFLIHLEPLPAPAVSPSPSGVAFSPSSAALTLVTVTTFFFMVAGTTSEETAIKEIDKLVYDVLVNY